MIEGGRDGSSRNRSGREVEEAGSGRHRSGRDEREVQRRDQEVQRRDQEVQRRDQEVRFDARNLLGKRNYPFEDAYE